VPINMAAFESEPEDIAKRLARQIIKGSSREDLLKLAGVTIRQRAQEHPDEPAQGEPTTPDELWDYIVERYGVRIARVSVCEDHDTPFDYVCAGFFEWYPNVFGIGPRGGGKSYDQALLHDLNSHWKPGCESATFGAVEEQAKRVYSAFKTFVDPRRDHRRAADLRDQLQARRRHELRQQGRGARRYGGRRQRAPPAEGALRRGRDHARRHLARVAQPRLGQDHARRPPHPAQNYATSTMKWKGGRVWQIFEAFKARRRRRSSASAGDKGARRRPDHQDDDLLRADLVHLRGRRAGAQLPMRARECRPARVGAGPGSRRSASATATRSSTAHPSTRARTRRPAAAAHAGVRVRGRFYRSRGHRTRAEVIQLFLQNDQRTWARAAAMPRDRDRGPLHPQVLAQAPRPRALPARPRQRADLHRNGLGLHRRGAVLWIQYLERAVEAIRYDGKTIVVPRGARVAISELTIAQKTATELGQLAIMREIKLANVLSASRVPVRKRWADLQGAGDRRDWAKMGCDRALLHAQLRRARQGVARPGRRRPLLRRRRRGPFQPAWAARSSASRSRAGARRTARSRARCPSTSSRPGATSSTACTTSTATPAPSRPSRPRRLTAG
jgi:hypothetical protein